MSRFGESARRRFWQWARPAIPSLLGSVVFVLIALVVHSLFPVERRGLWWASLFMQVLGLSLSVGALYFSAKDSSVPAPWRVFWRWLLACPLWHKPPPQSLAPSGFDGLRMGFFASGSSTPPASWSTDQKLVALTEVVNELHKTLAKSVYVTDGRLNNAEARLTDLAIREERTRENLVARIRDVSVSNFYQVLAGLALLSIGSILSLFVS